MDNLFSYCILETSEEMEEVYLSIYCAGSGLAVGGMSDEKSREAAKALVDYVMQAEPINYAYKAYYFDGPTVLEFGIKDGTPYYNETEISSPEEYFAYDPDEYYRSLQMGLPALYYSGRENSPHPEIWVDYFLRMVELYSSRVCDLLLENSDDYFYAALSHLNSKEKEFLVFLIKKHLYEFIPIDVSRMIKVSNKTINQSMCKIVWQWIPDPGYCKGANPLLQA